ncbi:MAG TPA: hypothetical protein PLU47_16075 [Azonexus sp.]|nr:hypothetical protein [Azonexus sp.]
MENIQQNGITENPVPAVSKIDRLQQRAQRLQQEAQQARERVREEAALQEKLARLKERQRIDREVRLLGAIARVAGLAELGGQRGKSPEAGDTFDVDLLIGALSLLREQFLETIDVAQQANLRVRGEALRKAHFADRKNPRFGVSLLIPNDNNGETNHDY